MRDEDHTDCGNGNGNDIFNDKSRSSRINVGSDTRVDGRHLYTSRCSLQRVVGLDRHFVDRVPPQPACLEDVIRAISFTQPSAQAHPSSQTHSSSQTHPSSSLLLQLQQQPLVLLSSMGAYHFLPEEDAFPTDLHRPHRSKGQGQGQGQGGNTRGMTAEEDEDYDEDENEDSEFGPSSLSKEGEGMAGSGGGNTGVSTEATLVRRAEVLELFAMVKAADNVLGDRRTAGGGRSKDAASATTATASGTNTGTTTGTGTGTTVGREGVLVVRSLWSRLLSDESSGGRVDGTRCVGERRAGESDRTYPGEGNAGGGGGSSTSRNDPSSSYPSSDDLPSDYLSTNSSSGNAPFSNTPSSDDPPGEGSSYDSVDSSPAHHASLNRSHTYAVSMGDTHILLFVAPRDHRRAVRAIR